LLLASGASPGRLAEVPGERDCYARFVKSWINN